MSGLYDPTLPPDPFNQWDPRNQPPETGGGLGATAAGAGGGAIGLVVLLAVVVVAMVVALVSGIAGAAALVGVPILIGITKLFRPGKMLGIGATFVTLFYGFLAFIVARLILGALHLIPVEDMDPSLSPTFIIHFIRVQTLPLIACAWIIAKRIGDPYEGFSGFLKALIASLITFLLSFMVVCAIAYLIEGIHPKPKVESGQVY
ncbi:MAG: hypothetical protein ABI743_03510 [bacterium]